jgi:hypothetical protein
MRLSDSVLIESKSARDQGLSAIVDHELQQRLLSKVKSAFFDLWRGTGYMSMERVAAFYGVSIDVIKKNRQRHTDEFASDGVICVEGDDLREVKLGDILSPSSANARHAYLFTPRAAIRIGFILQESEVAAQVRTSALNLIQGAGDLFEPKILEALLDKYPVLSPFAGLSGFAISSPLFPYYDSVERHLKKNYPNGGIPGMSKDVIRKELAALSTWTARWKLDTKKDLRYTLASDVCVKSPDLTSPVLEIVVDGQPKKAVLMFQISDLLVDEQDVETAIGRQYIKRAKEHYQVDFAFLFLIAPFGCTPKAENYLRRDLPEEVRGFVGVMTVKEVAETLLKQAKSERNSNLIKGEAKKDCKAILNYKIPENPLMMMLDLF